MSHENVETIKEWPAQGILTFRKDACDRVDNNYEAEKVVKHRLALFSERPKPICTTHSK